MKNLLSFLTKFNDPKTKWKYILIVVTLAFIVGGGILGYQWWIGKKETKLPEIRTPEREEKPSEEEGIDVSEEGDHRILLTEKNLSEIWKKECPPKAEDIDLCFEMNYDSPTTEVLYSSWKNGISLKIPYNPNWGNEKFKITPYYEYEDNLGFGPLSPQEGAGWKRVYSIFFIPPRSTEEAITALKKEAIVWKDSIVKTRINDYDIVEYTVFEEICPPCETGVIEVIGKKYNYQFEDFFLLGAKELFEEIIKTIKFID
jgi:hypothetical protein